MVWTVCEKVLVSTIWPTYQLLRKIFRIAADVSHLTAKCVLLFSIYRNRSAEGVSLITQALYTLVFLFRYTDLFQAGQYKWNYFFKVFYIVSSLFTLGLMRFLFSRTREREISWKLGGAVLGGSLAASPVIMMIFREDWSLREWLWVLSQILESVCVLPQLLLLRQTSVPTVITSFYIVFLGSYRALYLVNWLQQELDTNGYPPNAVSVMFGLIQTALYADFAWVYWTRQRVKLRNGAVVDADDLSRGWLLNRILGKHVNVEPDDEESHAALERGLSGAPARTGSRAKWGARGISVSADDGVLDQEQDQDEDQDQDGQESGVADMDPDAKMQDPDELARALDEDYEDAPIPAGSSSNSDSQGVPGGVRNGDEWSED